MQNRLARLLEFSADLAGNLDVSSVAQRIAATITEVTDFQVAAVTVREASRCRRLAADGLDERRVGLETPYADWERLLEERFRVGSLTYLVRMDEVASAPTWSQQPDADLVVDAPAVEDAWTPDHGLVQVLRDHAGETLGFLSVDAPRSGRLPDPDTIELLELVAHQAQTALVNARLYGIAQRQRRAAETLREVIEAVSSSLDVEEVLKQCCDAVLAHSVGSRVSVFLLHRDGHGFVPVMSRGAGQEEVWRRFRALGTLSGPQVRWFAGVLASERPAVFDDVSQAELHADERALLEEFDIRSMAAYPLVTSGSKIGVLSVTSAGELVGFSQEERELVAQIARHAAMAIGLARSHAEARDHAQRVTELHELTKTMTETFDFAAIFERVSQAVRERSDARMVSVFEVKREAVTLLRADLGDIEESWYDLPFQCLELDDEVAAILDRVRSDGSVVIDDVTQTKALDEVTLPATRSLLVAGHLTGGGIPVALVASSDRPSAFDEGDAAFLRGLVQVTALALRNARLYEEARQAAERDSLTGLKNRRLFWTELNERLRTAGESRHTAVAVIDIDDYKAINDRYGHTIGDRVLAHVGDRLARNVRQTDTVYRIGGDEFTVMMPDTDREEAATVLERASLAVARSRLTVPLPTLSAGIAVAPDDSLDGDTLFGAADAAMYQAKRAGKNRVATARGGTPPGQDAAGGGLAC